MLLKKGDFLIKYVRKCEFVLVRSECAPEGGMEYSE